ncbi:hypothetical protein [Nocardia abscessus]|nr:hypothetical protein [Nocardia abscessus]
MEGAEAGPLSALLREVADAMDALGDIEVTDMTFHSVLTPDAELKPIVDVYYNLASDVDIAGEAPSGSNVVYHASQANPSGVGSDGVICLLKKFADETVGGLGDVTIEAVVFKPLLAEADISGDASPSMTVYYTPDK